MKAFCQEHCLLLEEQAPHVPTGLREFLNYCGATQSDESSVYIMRQKLTSGSHCRQHRSDRNLFGKSAAASQDIQNLHLPDVCTSTSVYMKAFCQEHCLLLEEQAPHVPAGLREFLNCRGHNDSWQPLYRLAEEAASKLLSNLFIKC